MKPILRANWSEFKQNLISQTDIWVNLENVTMAKLKFRGMIIEISRTLSGNVKGFVVNTDNLPPKDVKTMNKNLEMLIDIYSPKPGSFSTSTTNAIALWIANGLGKKAEIIEFD